jgi:PIN domain nuclease of toxin-antitoxin system
VKILLDTRIFLWLHTEPERLGDHLGLMEDQRNTALVAQAGLLDLPILTADPQVAAYPVRTLLVS